MVATEAAEDIKESDREATDLGWVLRADRLLSIWPSQNMATTRGTGELLLLLPPVFESGGKICSIKTEAHSSHRHPPLDLFHFML